MDFSSPILVIGVVFAALIGLILIKKIHHKITGIIIIILGLFLYFTFLFAFKDSNINLTSFAGFIKALQIYFNWLGTLIDNIRTITAHAIRLEWSPNYNYSS